MRGRATTMRRETMRSLAERARELHERLNCDTRCLDPECGGCKRELDMIEAAFADLVADMQQAETSDAQQAQLLQDQIADSELRRLRGASPKRKPK